MIQDLSVLVDQYSIWLKDNTNLRKIGNCIEITTPYLDRHNDYLQIYVKRANDGFILTDDGYVLEDLELSGCKIESPKRKDILRTTLNGFGVKENNRALEIDATSDNFPIRQHSLLQAMLAVNDLHYLASPSVSSLFHEDVRAWLDSSDILYTPNVKITGKSGYHHRFDFVISKSKTQPERVLKAIDQPDRNATEKINYSLVDTKEALSKTRAYAILNDSNQSTPRSVLDALHSYEVRTISWSARNEARDELAA